MTPARTQPSVSASQAPLLKPAMKTRLVSMQNFASTSLRVSSKYGNLRRRGRLGVEALATFGGRIRIEPDEDGVGRRGHLHRNDLVARASAARTEKDRGVGPVRVVSRGEPDEVVAVGPEQRWFRRGSVTVFVFDVVHDDLVGRHAATRARHHVTGIADADRCATTPTAIVPRAARDPRPSSCRSS